VDLYKVTAVAFVSKRVRAWGFLLSFCII